MTVGWKGSLVVILALVMSAVACRGSEPGTAPTSSGAVQTTGTVPPSSETPGAVETTGTVPPSFETPAETGGTTSERDLTGTWSGTWANVTPDNSEGTFELTWEQQGAALEGTITIEGTACLNAGVITGTVSGRDVDFGVVQREVEVRFTGTVSGNKMSGTFKTNCDDAAGHWKAKRYG